jgi:hypothetical protein
LKVIDLWLDQLKEAPWNPNRMDEAMLQKLRDSLSRFGLVQNLVVRLWKQAAMKSCRAISGSRSFGN